jgi:bifunctional non-homologous end joining protein LigD
MRNSEKSDPKQATREHHPSVFREPGSAGPTMVPFRVPVEREKASVTIDSRTVRLTNMHKPFWPELGITKGDLLQYYADVARFLLPHIRDRAMVMKRYPNGAFGDFFFMKRAPSPRPKWIALCEIGHASGNVIHYPVVQDLPTLLWIINLGCIDLNPWYARCDDVDRPDYMHFDLDPVKGDVQVAFAKVREVALRVRDSLDRYKIPSFAKTSGSRGIHVYVPIERGPTQKKVWAFAKAFARRLAAEHPSSITAEYCRSAQRDMC